MGGTNWKTYDNRNGHLFMNSFRIDSNHWTWQAWVRLAKKYRWQDVKKLYEDFPKNAKTGGCWCDQQGPWSPCLAPPNFGHSLAGGTVPPKQNGYFLVHITIFNTLKLHCFMKWSLQKHDLPHLRNWTLAIWNWYLHQKTSVADIADKKLLSFILLFGSELRFDFTKLPTQFYLLIFVWGIAM